MSKNVQVMGLEEVKAKLRNATLTMPLDILTITKPTAQESVDTVAKPISLKQKDTGALTDSIHIEQISVSKEAFEIDVVAGSKEIVRGLGPYTVNKDGKPIRSIRATEEYASTINAGHGDAQAKGFMTPLTFDWLKKNLLKRIGQMLQAKLSKI